VRASLVTWLVFAVPHLVYHAATLHHHPLPIDGAGNVVGLGFVILLPLILLALHETRRTSAKRTTDATRRG
jgi:hypothetical protein